VGALLLFFGGEGVAGHVWPCRAGGGIQRGKRVGIAGPRVRIQQTDDKLVVSVAGVAMIHEESARGIHGRGESANQAMHFRARGCGACNGGEAGERRKILAKVRAGAEVVVPAAHVLAGRRETGALAIDLQHAVFTEVQEERVILVELALQRPIQQPDRAVGERG